MHMLGVPSLHHKHHVVLFIFTIFFLQQYDIFIQTACYILTTKAQV
jgi:hypothetical protein